MEYVTSEGIIVTNRIFVGSIPDWMCENKLHLAFQDLDFNVQDTRIVVDMRTGRKKGYGFVTFYDANDAVELVKKGFVLTKDGVKLKVDTAVRKKGLQLRLQREKKFFERVGAMNQTYNVNNAMTGLYPTEAIQTQARKKDAMYFTQICHNWH
ncbi:boule-like isoform X2 [Paramuricea clavata]|uniref:Boule-like isoform X2 n=1 Tax=Paramuricea clavata TaxID=317549 RepID=A0A6S7FZW4_PARCT|nr:boule-like isoform X2 [Paramuricea clavata]